MSTPQGPRRFDSPDDELRDLYQRMSMREVAEHYGVGETVVWKRVKEHGITLEGMDSHGHRRKPAPFTDEHLAKMASAR